jgi:hypothetical protein
LLCQDADAHSTYEIEIQLGKTDESHIIRTIEYRDLERKRYPQYDHNAVVVAEEITSRFLNVISLFNGVIPLVAIQITSPVSASKYALVFRYRRSFSTPSLPACGSARYAGFCTTRCSVLRPEFATDLAKCCLSRCFLLSAFGCSFAAI